MTLLSHHWLTQGSAQAESETGRIVNHMPALGRHAPMHIGPLSEGLETYHFQAVKEISIQSSSDNKSNEAETLVIACNKENRLNIINLGNST